MVKISPSTIPDETDKKIGFYNEALAALETGDYQRASLAFRNACDIEPSYKQEIEKLSQYYRSKGEVNKAIFLYSVYMRL